MTDLKTLKSLFNEALYRIPDYQRGYAWGEEQLRDFWNDLRNLGDVRNHYTGVLTLKLVDGASIASNANERWLVDNGYKIFYVIDGQQRLTTAVILIQAIIETVRRQPENVGKIDANISFCDESLSDHIKTYLSISKSKEVITTYKFGYAVDNPSDLYFRHEILGEPNPGSLEETFYTLNLANAKKYFLEQLEAIVKQESVTSIEQIFRKLIARFQFNPYEIPSNFDEFLAFETMNNRGKQLSHLELLKNRLIYLSTLYSDKEADSAEKKELRDLINEAWKEAYYNLGKNKKHPLNDDEFLRAHWILYFMYSRKKGDDYIQFLLNRKFAIDQVLKKKPVVVKLEKVEEVRDLDQNDHDDTEGESETTVLLAELHPKDIKKYVNSLKETSKVWYTTWFPLKDDSLNEDVAFWVDKINRLSVSFCRPLVTALLFNKNITDNERISTFKALERYLFIAFKLNKTFSNSGSSEFFNAARQLFNGEWGIKEINEMIAENTAYYFEDGKFKSSNFKQFIAERFSSKKEDGFYGWKSGLPYFLYEYELSLMKSRNTPKIDWNLFIRSEKDKNSIEHIFPQNSSNKYWKTRFKEFTKKEKMILTHNLGNLLPLSKAINASLQNDGFDKKKLIQRNAEGEIVRNGYENGSYSEIEVSSEIDWTAENITKRGLVLLKFLEERWGVSLGSKKEKLELLNLEFLGNK